MQQWERDLIADRRSGKYCPRCDGNKHEGARLLARYNPGTGVTYEVFCTGKGIVSIKMQEGKIQ